MIIDCSKIYDATSDTSMVKMLAKQTGYYPIFTFLNSFKNLIDIASVGLVGQKGNFTISIMSIWFYRYYLAGLSSSLQDQVKEVLDVVEQGLRQAVDHVSRQREDCEKGERRRSLLQADRLAKIRSGYFHDGRIDCVSGNGIISELGVGIERFDEIDGLSENHEDRINRQSNAGKKEYKSIRPVEAMPIVIIKHYDPNCQGNEAIITTALTNWVGRLVSNKVSFFFQILPRIAQLCL